ncbi:MAG: glycosyltransferase family 2 protein [Acidobacteriota bacterium]
MRVGVVLVHYRTPGLAASAAASLHRDAEASGLDLDLVLVDNGSTPDDRAFLGRLDGVRIIDPGENLGYAGAFNLGAERLGDADVLAVMNPDVSVLPGCLRALVDALGAGAGVVGPRFWWDRRGRYMLPPTEERGRRQSLSRFLSQRLGAGRARSAWRRHARRHWLSAEPVASLSLSGAFLAIERGAWRRVGPFDDRYRLYFEESDWLERARRAGVRGLYVPSAEAHHAYAQSTVKEPRAERWFLGSHRRFRRQHYGRAFTATLELMSRHWLPRRPVLESGPPRQADVEAAEWIEVAASPEGFPAAALHLGRHVLRESDGRVPIPEGRFWLRGLRGDRELWAYGPP